MRRSLAKHAYDHGIEARVGAAELAQTGQAIVAAHGEPSVVVDLGDVGSDTAGAGYTASRI